VNKNKIYFASDFHLGTPNMEESRIREKQIVSWLDEIKKDAKSCLPFLLQSHFLTIPITLYLIN